jgi:hypothetical protein
LIFNKLLVLIKRAIWNRVQSHPLAINGDASGAGYFHASTSWCRIGADGNQNSLDAPFGKHGGAAKKLKIEPA